MKIVKARAMRDSVPEYIKEIDAPVIIYGAGLNGRNVCRFIKSRGIRVLAFVVSDGHSISEKAIEDHPVLFRFELCKYSGYVLILATGDYPFEKETIAGGESAFPGCRKILRLSLGDVVEMEYEYYSNNREEFEQTYGWLVDNLSKQVMESYINARIGGDMTSLLEAASPYDYDFSLLLSGKREVYVDCGAYIGSSIELFLSSAPTCDGFEIFAFEPDSKMVGNLKTIYSDRSVFTIFEKAVYSQAGFINFNVSGYGNSRIADSGEFCVETVKIDDVLSSISPTIIKMDVEGAELEALRGAEEKLRSIKPRLAICVYHKQEDLITIPQYLKSVNPGYKFLLRHHNKKWISELVLYAV